jgi:glyoxylase-like metal-dependent hydrolase (beta-lactamase superfamily II)
MKSQILKLELPVPYPVATVNAYFIDGPEPTLVDTGLYWEKSLQALNEQLNKNGRRLTDIRRILLTHDHLDHAGAALYLSQLCKATLYAHKKSMVLAPYSQEMQERLFTFLLRCGTPRELMERRMLKAFSQARYFVNLDAKPHALEWLEGGETINCGGLPLEAISTPGHSPDHLCFFDQASGVIFCGDMLIGHITPNPLLYLDPNDEYRRSPSLLNYIDSLAKLQALRLTLGYPGHGQNIDDFQGLIAKNQAFIEQRQKIFLEKIAQGSRVPYELARAVFGEINPMEQYLAVSETIAYLDLLERDRKITVDWNGDPITIRPRA